MKRAVSALLAASALALASQALAQAWPSKPLRMIVNFPPGGAADQLGRGLGQRLNEALGQPVVVENRPGANGSVGAGEAARSPPDGYTLLMSSGGAIALNGLLHRNLGYDPMKSLEPVAPVAIVSVYLEIKASIPANTLAEFIAHLRANPGKLTTALPGTAARRTSPGRCSTARRR